MGHIHLPDGVLPPWLIVLSFALCGALLALANRRLVTVRGAPLRIASMCSLMVLSMSIPILFLPVHANMAALAGIVLGGWQALVAVFVANLILAFVQHGGITVVGLNTLILGTEAALASVLFSSVSRAGRLKGRHAPAAAAATLVALLVATVFMGAALVASSPRGSAMWALAQPFLGPAGITLDNTLSLPAFGSPSLARVLLRLVVPVIIAGLAVETAITALIVGFVAKVRPGLIDRH